MKRYDKAYFDQWYRGEDIETGEELRRRVSLVVAVTEQLLARPLRSMLDIGCGEGRWGDALKEIRPEARYVGIDPSDYAVSRHGTARKIRKGSFGTLDAVRLEERFDAIVCSDVLHYLTAREIDRGLRALRTILDGVAYLAVHTREDDPTGDLAGWHPRTATWYRERFNRAGLQSCGMQCWVGPVLAASATALEIQG